MRLDPRTKILILAVTSVSVFMNKSIAVECVLAGIPLVLLSVSGNLKRMLKYAAFFLALLLIQLFIVPRLPVTFGGIVYMFAVYIRKLLPCFMLGSFLIATTSVSKFLAAITKLRLSKGLTIALAITLRYFPTMREEWASIRDAMALRGISASAAGLISHPIQTMEYVYVPLLVSASRISDEIMLADHWDTQEYVDVINGSYSSEEWLYQDVYILKNEDMVDRFVEVLMIDSVFAQSTEDYTRIEIPGLDQAWVTERLECIAVKGTTISIFTHLFDSPEGMREALEVVAEKWGK